MTMRLILQVQKMLQVKEPRYLVENGNEPIKKKSERVATPLDTT